MNRITHWTITYLFLLLSIASLNAQNSKDHKWVLAEIVKN